MNSDRRRSMGNATKPAVPNSFCKISNPLGNRSQKSALWPVKFEHGASFVVFFFVKRV